MARRPDWYYEKEDEIAQIIDDLEFYTYYQLLDLQPDASRDVVQYQINLLQHEWDKLRRDHHCTAALYKNLTLLLDRLDEARQVLTSEALRFEYDRGIELGETRHARVAAERAAQRPAVQERKDDYIEEASRYLEKKIPQQFRQSGEHEEVYQPIEREHLERLTTRMEARLRSDGIDLQAEEDEQELVEDEADDGSYLDEAVAHLERELAGHGVELGGPAAAEDRSASADEAGILVKQLAGELEQLGLQEALPRQEARPRESILAEINRIELESQARRRPGGLADPAQPPRAEPIAAPREEPPADAWRGLTRASDEEELDFVIPVDAEEAAPPAAAAPRARPAPPPAEVDADFVIQLDDEET